MRRFLKRLGVFVLFELIMLIPIYNFFFVADLLYREKNEKRKIILDYENKIRELRG